MNKQKQITNTFNFNIPKSKKVAYIILVDGKRVKLSSGKYVWNGIGAAKSALTNHLQGIKYATGCDWNDFEKYITEHVIFMPLSQYEADMSRLQKEFGD